MKVILFTFCLFILFKITTVQAHPLHITITNIDITGDSIKVIIRIFIDDFTLALMSENKITKTIKLTESNELINSYIKHHLILQTNKANLILKQSKSVFDDESIIIYLKTHIDSQPSELTIENSLLCNLYGDQRNMVIISYLKNEKGIMFSPIETKQTFLLN